MPAQQPHGQRDLQKLFCVLKSRRVSHLFHICEFAFGLRTVGLAVAEARN